MGPIRGLPLEVIESISAQDVSENFSRSLCLPRFSFSFLFLFHFTLQVPSVGMSDFLAAFKHVKASVSPNDLKQYISWNQQYGSFQV